MAWWKACCKKKNEARYTPRFCRLAAGTATSAVAAAVFVVTVVALLIAATAKQYDKNENDPQAGVVVVHKHK